MQAHHIGAAQGGFQVGWATAAGDGIHRHPEGFANPGHTTADVTGANHAEPPACQLIEFRFHQGEDGTALPAAIGHLLPPFLQIARQFQNQGPGDLHHRGFAVAPSVVEGDAQLAAGGLIHLVGAGAGGANQPELGELAQQRPIEGDFVGDGDGCAREALEPFFALGAGPTGEVGLLLQRGQIDRTQA